MQCPRPERGPSRHGQVRKDSSTSRKGGLSCSNTVPFFSAMDSVFGGPPVPDGTAPATGWDELHPFAVKHLDALAKNHSLHGFQEWRAHLQVRKDSSTSRKGGLPCPKTVPLFFSAGALRPRLPAGGCENPFEPRGAGRRGWPARQRRRQWPGLQHGLQRLGTAEPRARPGLRTAQVPLLAFPLPLLAFPLPLLAFPLPFACVSTAFACAPTPFPCPPTAFSLRSHCLCLRSHCLCLRSH